MWPTRQHAKEWQTPTGFALKALKPPYSCQGEEVNPILGPEARNRKPSPLRPKSTWGVRRFPEPLARSGSSTLGNRQHSPRPPFKPHYASNGRQPMWTTICTRGEKDERQLVRAYACTLTPPASRSVSDADVWVHAHSAENGDHYAEQNVVLINARHSEEISNAWSKIFKLNVCPTHSKIIKARICS